MTRTRCPWAEQGDPAMRAYHDEEWGVPQHDPRRLWEMLMLEGFQAGLSWKTILDKRAGFRAAFADFDPAKVAAFDDEDVARLLGDARIVRSRAKIEATIRAAQLYEEMGAASFRDFCWGFTDGQPLQGGGRHVPAKTALSEHISKEMKVRGFKFVGPTIVYAWMQATGIVNDHLTTCYRRDEVVTVAS